MDSNTIFLLGFFVMLVLFAAHIVVSWKHVTAVRQMTEEVNKQSRLATIKFLQGLKKHDELLARLIPPDPHRN